MMKSLWITGIAGGLIGLAVLAIGMRGLITKKPFAYPAWYNLCLFAPIFLPALIRPLHRLLDDSAKTIVVPFDYIFLAIMVVFLMFLRKQMSGYIIVGVTDDSFQTALRSALQRNDIRFEETLSQMHLPELGADLQASGNAGVAHLRVKQPQHQDTLMRIVNTLNEEFSSPVSTFNKTIFVLYVILGVLMFAMCTLLVFT